MEDKEKIAGLGVLTVSGSPMIRRKSIRAVMLTPDGKMLLMQVQEPSSDFVVWFAPGGGIENSETPEECLRREIREETGFVLKDIGPLIWYRHHTFDWGNQVVSQDEDFYLVRTESFQPDSSANPSEAEIVSFRHFRWWTSEEISVSKDNFAPRKLAMYLRELVDDLVPAVPIDVGI